ncbi:MAG: ParB/RepB/Spo0J family partition protein [Clostridia bacterium]|nr:ParB/RepB/Spo0J family partition protein [Clostridia bacterium]
MINPFENVHGHRNETTCAYALTNIYPMENHPFKVKDDEDMAALVESIRQYGVLNPIIVRKRQTGGGYEIVSGHRRYEACKRLNKFDIPVIVRDLTDEEAILTMVDANLQRERILPSEKAFAYKMKMDVLRHQGSSCQDGTKRSDETLAESTDDSARQIQRYIRLTYLIPELLKMVDEGIVPLTAGVNYSYMRQFEQLSVWMMLMDKSMSITTDKTEEMKNASKTKELNEEDIRGYFKCNATESKEKAPKKQSVKFAFDEISDFFTDMKPKEVKDKIIEILFAWYDSQKNQIVDENGGESY